LLPEILNREPPDMPKIKTVIEESIYDASSPYAATSCEPLVSLTTWIELKQSGHHHGKGIRLAPDEDIDGVIQSLEQVSVIALESDSYADGRIYSKAMELRLRYGFKKELRAIGTTQDNLNMLLQCGFDSVEFEKNSAKSIREIVSKNQANNMSSIYN